MKDRRKHVSPECYPCIFRQIISIATLLKIDESGRKYLLEKSMRYLLETHGDGVVVQHVVRRVTDEIIDMMKKSSDFDPYKAMKKRSNDIALSHYRKLKAKITASDSPLQTAVKIAAAGNIIDFGARDYIDLDIEKELGSIDHRGFGIYDWNEFYKRLSTAGTLLYICDNSGEIVLDKLFMEELKKNFPSLDVVCAVRERPIINDALIDDAHYVGLDRVATVISSGSVYPGTILEETSSEFRECFDRSDLIISKGQGNFETLLDGGIEKMFFILRIKCELMASISNTQQGNLVLMQGKRQ